MPKLFNPRGRLVNVDDGNVQTLLKMGWLIPSIDQNGNYNPIYDKGEEVKPEPMPSKVEPKEVEIPRLGTTLGVETV